MAVESADQAWTQAHIHALEGGAPKLVIPDNAKTGVSRACRCDPDLNPSYQEMVPGSPAPEPDSGPRSYRYRHRSLEPAREALTLRF